MYVNACRDVMTQEFARLTRRAVTLGVLSIMDFGEFNRVCFARHAVSNLIRSKFDDPDQRLCLARFSDCALDVRFVNFNHVVAS
jgi:hypothetical protein